MKLNKKNYDHFSKITYLVLEAGTDCNLKCSFCPREDLVQSGKRPRKVMSLDEYELVLSKFDECNITDIKLHGLSEVMMIPKFNEYVSLVKKHQKKSHITLVTNGQYNLKSSSLLDTIPLVDEIWFSIDGIEDVYEKVRKGAKWSKMIKLLDDLSLQDDYSNIKNKIYIQFTLSSMNYTHLPKMYEIVEKYGFAGVRFNLVQDWVGSNENKFYEKDDIEMMNMVQKYKKDLKGSGGWKYKDCFWPYEGMFIDAYGDIRHCILNYTMKPIGNVFNDDIVELYNNGTIYTEAREGLQMNTPPPQCKTCDYNCMSDTIFGILGQGKSRSFQYQEHLSK